MGSMGSLDTESGQKTTVHSQRGLGTHYNGLIRGIDSGFYFRNDTKMECNLCLKS